MKKRILGWVMALSLLVTMLPVPAIAAEELVGDGLSAVESAQCACGAAADADGVTVHQEGCPLYEAPAGEEPPAEETGLDAPGFSSMGEPALLTTTADHSNHTGWTELSGTISSNSFYGGGSYWLDGDVTYGSIYSLTINQNQNVTLCLNGHTLDMGGWTINVESGATLTICDCSTGQMGTIKGTIKGSFYQLISVEGGTLNLKSGTISSEVSNGSRSLISVTDSGTLNVTGGTLSLAHTNSNGTVQAVKLSDSTGSFTGGEVRLTTGMSGSTSRATTVYQEGGTVTMGNNAKISFMAENDFNTVGSGALCVTGSGQVTINTGCTITALRTGGEMASAVSVGMLGGETGTATITGGDINGFLAVYGTATISGGSFDYIQNQGTLTMTGGTVNSSIDEGIRTSGATTLSNVSINAATGIYVSQGCLTIEDGVTIKATQYGVKGGAILVGAPSISGGTADLYIYSMYATTDVPRVDATDYTGTDELTVQEMGFPDAHQGGYAGYAIKVPQEKKDLFSLTNGGEIFTYEYNEGALRLYNTKSHPICGGACSHEDTPHTSPAWQKWSTPSNNTLTGGSYYLSTDVTLTQPITITGHVNLCLNGNTIKRSDGSSPFQVTEGGSLTICDCQTTGQLTGGITATGGNIGIYGGTISNGAYAVDLGGSATLTLSGSPVLTGTVAALKLYTQSGTTLENAAVDATDYTGGSLVVEENDVPGGANGFAIKGGENKFSLTNAPEGYHYAYEDGYVIRPDHTHKYTYSGSGAVITEKCTCDHSATATISIKSDYDLTYTGSAIEPAEVTYSDDWQGDKDLSVAYSDNVNAGTAKATINKGDAEASVTFTIKKANQAAPTASDCTIDYLSETITHIAIGCKVYTDEDASTEVQTGATVTPGTTYYIRREADDNHNPSGFTSFTVTARPGAPSVTAVPETIKGKRDGKVTGVTTAMEYSTDDGQNWKDCTGNEITGLAAGTTVTVRVKAMITAPHGETASCIIPEGTTTLSVTFDSNGGSTVTDLTGLSYNAKITAPAEPTKTGYTFGGWYKESTCTTEWNFSSDTVTKNITLYAKWTLEPPSVTITGAPEEPVTYGTSVTLTVSVTHDITDLDYTYKWYKVDTELTDQAESTLVLSTVADSGEYKVEVTATDTDGQTVTAGDLQTVSIMPASVEIPDPSDMKFTYNGQEQTYPIADNTLYTVTGNQQTDAGDYTVTVSLTDKDNYIWAGSNAEDRTYSFTIARKAIAVTWSGLIQVYGDTELVNATLSGVVGDDAVAVTVTEVEQTAGSHDLTATLIGADAANYTLKNSTATLTIRPKTVGFMVTDNAVEGDDIKPFVDPKFQNNVILTGTEFLTPTSTNSAASIPGPMRQSHKGDTNL